MAQYCSVRPHAVSVQSLDLGRFRSATEEELLLLERDYALTLRTSFSHVQILPMKWAIFGGLV